MMCIPKRILLFQAFMFPDILQVTMVSDIMHQEFFWNASPLATQKKYVPLIPVDLGGESSCR